MKIKRKWHKMIYSGLIFILTAGIILSPFGKMPVYAEEAGVDEEKTEASQNTGGTDDAEESGEESKDESDETGKESDEGESGTAESDESENEGNSGGFIIESEKVEGQIDIVGALLGEINISEGTIEGLTITKRLETGDERDPLVVQITSPGPVEVENLEASTLNGGPPHFGGICGLTPPCMTDVTMTVDHQFVEDISLPETEIITCFESECGNLPDDSSSTSTDDIQAMMEKMEKQDEDMEEMMEGVEDDRENLNTIKELLQQAGDTHNQIKDEQQVENLADVIEEMTALLEASDSDGQSAQSNDDGEKQDGDKNSEKSLVNLTEKADKQHKALDDISSKFFTTLNEALTAINELEESIREKEESLETIEKERADMEEEGTAEQAEMFADLLSKAEDGEGAEADKESNSDQNTDSGSDESEEIEVEAVKKKLDALNNDFDAARETADALDENETALQERKETIITTLSELKKVIQQSETDLTENHFEMIMDNLAFVPLTGADDNAGSESTSNENESEDASQDESEGESGEKQGNDSTDGDKDESQSDKPDNKDSSGEEENENHSDDEKNETKKDEETGESDSDGDQPENDQPQDEGDDDAQRPSLLKGVLESVRNLLK